MDPHEISLVQATFHRLGPIADQAAALFYARAFELDPSLRLLVRGGMKEQGHRLMRVVACLVDSLPRWEPLRPALRRLGARYRRLGLRDEHYATFGTALLWTVEKGLGHDFTPAVKTAWSRVFVAVASTLLDGAHAAERPLAAGFANPLPAVS